MQKRQKRGGRVRDRGGEGGGGKQNRLNIVNQNFQRGRKNHPRFCTEWQNVNYYIYI